MLAAWESSWNLGRPVFGALIALLLVFGHPGPTAAATRRPEPSPSRDEQAAELIRAWLIGERLPRGPTSWEFEPWRAFMHAGRRTSAQKRERALRELYARSDDELLRGVILRTLSEDPQLQSRQAAFIRRYGFYTNWLNRLMYTSLRSLQGNLQSIMTLGVDTVFALFKPAEANPWERRELDLMRRSESLDHTTMRKLKKKLDRRWAREELDRAKWLLHTGHPEEARFYALQAAMIRPGWNKAQRCLEAAEKAIARRRRQALSSAQVGYPDRAPPVDPADPAVLRFMQTWDSLEEPLSGSQPSSGEELLIQALAALPPRGEGGATAMRKWPMLLAEHRDAPAEQRCWLSALMHDPGQNPDERLDQARARRRGTLWRFIILGPERPREKAYKTATWLTHAIDALESVGLFYVFEVMGRAGQALFAPPVPGEEVLDAQAAWLRQAPDLRSTEARGIARDLIPILMERRRYDDARRMLKDGGLLTHDARRKIDQGQARWLSTLAAQVADEQDRVVLLERALALDPKLEVKNLDQAPESPHEPRAFKVQWGTLISRTGLHPPCGLPGKADWFDGDPNNGERMHEWVHFESRGPTGRLAVNYRVMFPNEVRAFEKSIKMDQLHPRLRGWLEFTDRQADEASRTIEKLDRLPVPFEFEGGVGASGVDFYPKLLPIESQPGELDLYR